MKAKAKRRVPTGQNSVKETKWFLPLSAVLFLATAVAVWRIFADPTSDTISSNTTSDMQLVPRQEIGDRDYKDIAEKRHPVILRGTIADRWLAREKFSAAFIAKRLHQVSAHRQEAKRSFATFHDDKPLEPLVVEKWEDFNVKVNTTIAEILQWGNPQRSKDTGPYMYYSQDIATLRDQFPDVIGYVQPMKPLILSDENVQVNLWVGREGLVTHTHYDCTYNFFVQLQGRKRFTLFPPGHTLYLFPCLHPHYGHSQVDVLQPDGERFPDYSSEGGFVADVSPGDMLIVPPFWFHHVETLSESVSVNVWSDAPEYALLNEIYALPVPFEKEWAWRDLLIATKLYLDMIIVSLRIGTPTTVMHRLLEQRYHPLIASKSLLVDEAISHRCAEECSQVDWKMEGGRFENTLSRGVDELCILFGNILSRDTMEICLANYVEHLVHSVIGLDYVYPFLSTCALIQQ